MLVDTHVLLWALAGDPRLGLQARSRLAAARGVHVSAMTHVELTIKQMLGKVSLPDDFLAQVTASGFTSVPVTEDDAAALTAFPDLTRHDPFDRILLAQASHRGWTFLTADDRLLALGLPWVLDARR